MKEKILLIELNEFSLELLNKGVKELGLKHIKRILQFNHSKTFSNDNLESQGLDPWVQWVSVHTGKPSNVHKVLRISDIPKLEFPQIWEVLSEKGISTGLWGLMNASRNNAKECKFFLPDPWAFSEVGYPISLNFYLDLPRYYSKNYVMPSKRNLVKGFFKFIYFFLRRNMFFGFLKVSFRALLIISRNGLKNMTLFSIFDLFNTFTFLKYKEFINPDLSIIFLNSLAHLQHHFWNDSKINKEMKMCLRILDNIFAKLINSMKSDESIVVINALSQKNVFNKGIYVYRQKDSKKLLSLLKIKYKNFEEGMTNDGHIFFNSLEECNTAFMILSNVKIDDNRLFFVEKDQKVQNKLFFQCCLKSKVEVNQKFNINNRLFSFYDYFILIRERTGEHISNGDILSEKVYFPKELKNHQISEYLYKFLEKNKSY